MDYGVEKINPAFFFLLLLSTLLLQLFDYKRDYKMFLLFTHRSKAITPEVKGVHIGIGIVIIEFKCKQQNEYGKWRCERSAQSECECSD